MVHLRVPDKEWGRCLQGDGQEPGYAGAARSPMRRRDRRLLHLAAGRVAHAGDLRGQSPLPDRCDRLHPGLPGRRRASGVAHAPGQGNRHPLAARDDEGTRRGGKGFRRVAAYAKAKLDLSEKATRDQWDTNTRPLALDKVYYDDFCSLSRWAQKER